MKDTVQMILGEIQIPAHVKQKRGVKKKWRAFGVFGQIGRNSVSPLPVRLHG